MVLFALFSFIIVGALALALDVGYLLSERRAAQNAADAAALAGGVALISGESRGSAASTALAYAAMNDVDLIGSDAALLTVNVTGTSRDGRVEVDLETPVQRFFLGAIYTGEWKVGAHAVSEVNDTRDGEYALIALEEPGMYVNGNMTIDVIGGSAMSNGDVARSGGVNAFTVDGMIDAAGFVDPNGNWDAPLGFNGKRPQIDNPFAGVAAPNPLYLDEIEDEPDCDDNCTLQPGYYHDLGRITIKKTAELEPGVYYFDGTSIYLQNTNARIEGDDVMLYFDGPASSTYFDPKNGEVHLTSSAISPYEGGQNRMLLWIANCSEFDSQGNGEFYLEGIFNAPCSDVTLHGNPDGTTVYGQVVVGTLDMRGTSDLVVRYMDLVDTPRYELYLVE
jgi:hypothetical protein